MDDPDYREDRRKRDGKGGNQLKHETISISLQLLQMKSASGLSRLQSGSPTTGLKSSITQFLLVAPIPIAIGREDNNGYGLHRPISWLVRSLTSKAIYNDRGVTVGSPYPDRTWLVIFCFFMLDMMFTSLKSVQTLKLLGFGWAKLFGKAYRSEPER